MELLNFIQLTSVWLCCIIILLIPYKNKDLENLITPCVLLFFIYYLLIKYYV